MKRIALLGSTGSIGVQTLDVVRRLPDRLQITALAAGSDGEKLAGQALDCGAKAVALHQASGEGRSAVESAFPPYKGVTAHFGPESLEEIATRDDVDIVVVAVAGAVGIRATIAALSAGKDVALATKEVLVAAGALVRQAAEEGGAKILPIDSEHCALFQCLQGIRADQVEKLWITASGGPFRGWTSEQLKNVTPSDALKHPTWSMGRKITIDSATLMNKGLETIEARWLFDIPVDRIDVVVHPQSVVHSMVEMIDGSLMAQLGPPDMRLPIEWALLYPDRADLGPGVTRLNPTLLSDLTFAAPDTANFPCLELARESSRAGGTMPAVMNAANEAVVYRFLDGNCPFGDIPRLIKSAMAAHESEWIADPDLEEILRSDSWARDYIGTSASR